MRKEPVVMADVKTAADRLFKTRDGQIVLKYLNQKYYDGPMATGSLERLIGRRDVLLHIKRLIEVDE
jgi:hypothetical protein